MPQTRRLRKGMVINMEIFDKICKKYHLGELCTPPIQLTGGFLHKMYSLFTSKGNYAVKMLNPYIMEREDALSNFCTAEALEKMLEESNLPILAAHSFDGRKMLQIDGQYFYLFDWYEGKALQRDEITGFHCREVAKTLAQIHAVDCRTESGRREEIHINWDEYSVRMQKENEELYTLLCESREILYKSQEKGNAAVKKLPGLLTICHNDMDSKNVLWKGRECRIIDLECLSYASPFLELFETALCWSGYVEGRMDFALFREFITSYCLAGGRKAEDWEVLYDSNYARLEWLEYNIKRVLGIDSGADEKEIGVSEVKNTLAQVKYYDRIKEDILTNLYE